MIAVSRASAWPRRLSRTCRSAPENDKVLTKSISSEKAHLLASNARHVVSRVRARLSLQVRCLRARKAVGAHR